MTSPVTLNAMQFAAAAGALNQAAAVLGLIAPGFRCPPRLAGADRSLRRRADGSVVVAVRVRYRATAAVLADMIEGVLAANRADGSAAPALRGALWRALEPFGSPVGASSGPAVLYRSDAARVA